MCGRFGFVKDKDKIKKRFNLKKVPNYPDLYNIAPGQKVPVVLNSAPDELAFIDWGLVRSWNKEAKPKIRPSNARAETIAQNRLFSGPIKSQRCLILATEFYEWKAATAGETKAPKNPYRIFLKSEDAFSFAAIYDTWLKDGIPTLTCCIITATPNQLMSDIHDRMPVILNPEDEAKWLSDIPLNFALSMLRCYPAEKMCCYRVSTLVNSVANNSADIIKPLGLD